MLPTPTVSSRGDQTGRSVIQSVGYTTTTDNFPLRAKNMHDLVSTVTPTQRNRNFNQRHRSHHVTYQSNSFSNHPFSQNYKTIYHASYDVEQQSRREPCKVKVGDQMVPIYFPLPNDFTLTPVNKPVPPDANVDATMLPRHLKFSSRVEDNNIEMVRDRLRRNMIFHK